MAVAAAARTGVALSFDDEFLIPITPTSYDVPLEPGGRPDASASHLYVKIALKESDDVQKVLVGNSGVSSLQVEIEGVPPVSSALAGLSWPELTDATRTRLTGLAGDANTQLAFVADWRYLHGPLGLHDTQFCAVHRGDCGRGGPGRLVGGGVRPGATTTTLTIPTGGQSLSAGEFKLFSLSGRTGEGLGLQANFSSCSGVPAGQSCFGAPPPAH